MSQFRSLRHLVAYDHVWHRGPQEARVHLDRPRVDTSIRDVDPAHAILTGSLLAKAGIERGSEEHLRIVLWASEKGHTLSGSQWRKVRKLRDLAYTAGLLDPVRQAQIETIATKNLKGPAQRALPVDPRSPVLDPDGYDVADITPENGD